jgi:DNA polymerase III subunit delta'
VGIFGDLVGQAEAERRLLGLLDSDRFPHAMLFEGPESVGKATMARAVGKRLLCKAPEGAKSCGVCGSCVKVEAGTHADLTIANIEDKQIKVDHVRELEAALRLRPLEGTRKVLIIPDADRMNPAAQNALLKTLEEPRGSSHLILTTARMKALLPTVISRCQRVPFAPIPTPVIAEVVAKSRGLSLEQAGLIAALAHGSLGRAMSLDIEALVELRDKAASLDRDLDRANAKSAILALEHAENLAADKEAIAVTLDFLSLWLHDQTLLASGASLGDLANLDRRADLEALAERRSLRTILDRAQIVMEAKRQLAMTYNFNPLLLAEELCLALCGHAELPYLDRPAR